MDFDIEIEMIKYWTNDVDILRFGCLQFMQDISNINGINPFTVSLTMASVCMLVFRKNFLKKDTLGIMHKNGYTNFDNQSRIGCKWLAWENMRAIEEIASAVNTG